MALEDHCFGSGDEALDEWFVLGREPEDRVDQIKEAVDGFEGDPRHPVAADGVDWLKRAAPWERACLTRLLFNDGQLAAFYALSSAEVEISRGKELERLGILGNGRVPASHMDWAVRSRLFKGIGMRVLLHATLAARDVAQIQGNLVLSLDPYDDGTAKMWREFGFEESATKLGKGLRRMYLPLFGYRALKNGRE
jgi:hypothetical protein